MSETTSLTELLEALHGDYVIRMMTDGMRGAGILEGDHLIVRKTETAPDGAIAVLTIKGEATVKRVHHEPDGRLRLEADRPEIAAIVTSEAYILGVVIGLARRLK